MTERCKLALQMALGLWLSGAALPAVALGTLARRGGTLIVSARLSAEAGDP